MIQIKSVLAQIAEKVFQMKDLEEAKEYIEQFLEDKEINERDKESLILGIHNCKNINRLWSYIANALLKYEGMGSDMINNGKKTDKKDATLENISTEL